MIKHEHRFIVDYVQEVVNRYDWTMPEYSEEEHGCQTVYECECLDIGHEREYDIAEIVIANMIKDGKITQDQVEKLEDVISDIVWDIVASEILANMSEEE